MTPGSPPRARLLLGGSATVDHAPPNVLLVAADEADRVVGYTAVHPEDGEMFLLFVDPAW